MSSSKLSRRAALTAAATLAAVPVTAGAAVDAVDIGAVSFPELVDRFVRVCARRDAQLALDRADSAKTERLLDQATGLTREQRNEIKPTDPRWADYVANLDRIVKENPSSDPVDEDGDSVAWNEIHDELFPLCDAILERRPQSLADLAWQAEAFIVAYGEFLDDENGAGALKLADNIRRLARMGVAS